MKLFRIQISLLVFLLAAIYSAAQQPYVLQLKGVDKDSAIIISQTGMQTSFASRSVCEDYISKLPGLLHAKGFITSSVDDVQYSNQAARLTLFLGEAYQWIKLDPDGTDNNLLAAAGWQDKLFAGRLLDFSLLSQLEDRMLNYLENNGHPFARISLDSVQLAGSTVSAKLRVEKGPLYKIDSIRVYGNGKISGNFLQHYLDIPNGSIYNKEKLQQVDKKLRELAYVEPERSSNLTMLNTGAVLNVYLKQKKSSQFNALVGFLPNNQQLAAKKLMVTGEANVLLRNALGAGETIGLNWQKLQVKSQRLNVIYQHPFLFRSPFGVDFSFDLLQKDSSFVNVNLQLGAQYVLNSRQSGKVFFQRFQTILSGAGINEQLIIQTRRLPDAADISWMNAGIEYTINNTDYRLNPRKGNELQFTASAGSRNIKRNNQIENLKDPNDPGFNFGKLYDTLKLKSSQFRLRAMAAHYFPLGKAKRSTLKTALNGGYFNSKNIFRNELFQVGGYKLLRGFDEESEYLSRFAIATAEYRLILDRNSFFYVLADAGWGTSINMGIQKDHTYFGTGIGLAFETKAGIFNLAWAVGNKDGQGFNLRQSKIHVGFVNYF